MTRPPATLLAQACNRSSAKGCTSSVLCTSAPALVAEHQAPGTVAMAGSLLEALRFPKFLHDEENNSAFGLNHADGKVPRFNGDPTRFSEWQFRVRAKQRREKNMTKEKREELGPLGLRLLEGLSGHALQIAQLLSIDELEKEGGADYLMEKLITELRPRRQQQARELYEAGAQQGGMLSRQSTETMPQYILRRRAWYRAMVDLNSELKLPDLVLAEQLLVNSGISEDHRLLIRTTVGATLTFDKVAAELVNQHPNAGVVARRPFEGGRPAFFQPPLPLERWCRTSEGRKPREVREERKRLPPLREAGLPRRPPVRHGRARALRRGGRPGV